METMGERIKRLRKSQGLTQEELAQKVGVKNPAIYKWEKGLVKNLKQDTIAKLAKIFNVKPSYLLCMDDETLNTNLQPDSLDKFDNIFPIEKHKIPLLGEIACGEPIFADEHKELYIETGTDIRADFCLKAKGNSMINARINDGDIVFIRQQPTVENGEIAAVVIDDEATLKRVNYYQDQNILVLKPENSDPAFKDLIYTGEELDSIRILGKAIAFQSDVK
ncbi:MAG: LexA family protein [Bacillota bacterium]|jgi:repressor LexA